MKIFIVACALALLPSRIFAGAASGDEAESFSLERATREFPLMTLTMASSTNKKRALDHYAKIVDISTELKRHLKGLKNRTGSIYLKDRRED